MKMLIVVMAVLAAFILLRKYSMRGIASIDKNAARELIKTPGVLILDVRTEGEFAPWAH